MRLFSNLRIRLADWWLRQTSRRPWYSIRCLHVKLAEVRAQLTDSRSILVRFSRSGRMWQYEFGETYGPSVVFAKENNPFITPGHLVPHEVTEAERKLLVFKRPNAYVAKAGPDVPNPSNKANHVYPELAELEPAN